NQKENRVCKKICIMKLVLMKTKKYAILSVLIIGSIFLMSHAVWMESLYKGVVGDEVVLNLYFGEFEKDLREKDEKLNGMSNFKALYIHENHEPVFVPLTKRNKSFNGVFTAKEPGFYQILAINDEREVQDWTKHGLTVIRPVEFQRSSFTAFSEEKTDSVNIKPYFFLDIIPDYELSHKGEVCSIFEKGKLITGTIYLNKKPLLHTKIINVYSPERKISTINSDGNGKFSFKAESAGMYLLTATLGDATPGKFKGKDYKFIRYHISTTLYVE
ncbi:MAG: hypothetical protein C0490_09480, partial [Marivirga sp.]|nr:hypothetical protein [Marivirga sp.]